MRRITRHDVDTDSRGALVTRVAPPSRGPHIAVTSKREPLTGQRVIVARPTEWVVDMRACSEPRRTVDGDWVIDVCDEADWYLYRNIGIPWSVVSTRRVSEVWTD